MKTPDDRRSTPGPARCSFCDKGPEAVGELIEGPAFPGRMPASICPECVELCSSIVAHRGAPGVAERGPDRSLLDAETGEVLEARVNRCLSVLTRIEGDVIRLRYGLADGFTYSDEEIGGRLDIAPGRVAEIATGAVAKLRSPETRA